MAGERRYLGIGEEAVFGTQVPATDYVDFLRAELDAPDNPFLTYEGAAGRALGVVAPGIYVPSGSIEIPVDLEKIGFFMKWVMGDFFATGTPDVAATTLAAMVSKGDNQVTVNAEAGFNVGDLVQVGDSGQEILKIQALDGGAGPTYTWTLEWAAKKDHPNAEAVQEVVAPFTHTFIPVRGAALPSFSGHIGKGVFEHNFEGGVISRLSFNVERGFLTAQMDILAKRDSKAALNTLSKTLPTSILSFRQGSLSLNTDLTGAGQATDLTSLVESYSLEMNNNVDESAGVRHGSRFAREFEVQGLDVSGSVRFAFKNTDEYERFWADAVGPQDAAAVTEFILEEKFVAGTSELSLIGTRCHWTRVSAPVQGRDRIAQEAQFVGLANSNWDNHPVNLRLKNSEPTY